MAIHVWLTEDSDDDSDVHSGGDSGNDDIDADNDDGGDYNDDDDDDTWMTYIMFLLALEDTIAQVTFFRLPESGQSGQSQVIYNVVTMIVFSQYLFQHLLWNLFQYLFQCFFQYSFSPSEWSETGDITQWQCFVSICYPHVVLFSK